MSNILEQATSHFREKLSNEMKYIVVPEWGNAKIYYKSVTTLKEEGKLVELAQAGKTIEAMVETLIIKARNEDGTRMFNAADKITFMNEVDPAILLRVISDINKVGMIDAEEVEKN